MLMLSSLRASSSAAASSAYASPPRAGTISAERKQLPQIRRRRKSSPKLYWNSLTHGKLVCTNSVELDYKDVGKAPYLEHHVLVETITDINPVFRDLALLPPLSVLKDQNGQKYVAVITLVCDSADFGDVQHCEDSGFETMDPRHAHLSVKLCVLEAALVEKDISLEEFDTSPEHFLYSLRDMVFDPHEDAVDLYNLPLAPVCGLSHGTPLRFRAGIHFSDTQLRHLPSNDIWLEVRVSLDAASSILVLPAFDLDGIFGVLSSEKHSRRGLTAYQFFVENLPWLSSLFHQRSIDATGFVVAFANLNWQSPDVQTSTDFQMLGRRRFTVDPITFSYAVTGKSLSQCVAEKFADYEVSYCTRDVPGPLRGSLYTCHHAYYPAEELAVSNLYHKGLLGLISAYAGPSCPVDKWGPTQTAEHLWEHWPLLKRDVFSTTGRVTPFREYTQEERQAAVALSCANISFSNMVWNKDCNSLCMGDRCAFCCSDDIRNTVASVCGEQKMAPRFFTELAKTAEYAHMLRIKPKMMRKRVREEEEEEDTPSAKKPKTGEVKRLERKLKKKYEHLKSLLEGAANDDGMDPHIVPVDAESDYYESAEEDEVSSEMQTEE